MIRGIQNSRNYLGKEMFLANDSANFSVNLRLYTYFSRETGSRVSGFQLKSQTIIKKSRTDHEKKIRVHVLQNNKYIACRKVE